MCIFDELFSGTNPLEATASAISLLNYLANYMNIDFLLTTHFTEVCEKLKTNPRICLKRMRTTENPMQYTYKIEQGISYVRGGVVILEQMGFPTPIVEKAICG
jgi:DNA mismatch repair ATPase MutS